MRSGHPPAHAVQSGDVPAQVQITLDGAIVTEDKEQINRFRVLFDHHIPRPLLIGRGVNDSALGEGDGDGTQRTRLLIQNGHLQSHFPRKAGNPQLPPLIQGIFRAFVTRGEPDGLLGQGTAVLPLKAGEDVKAFLAEKEQEYTDKFANPYQAAQYGYIDDVIEPRNTRFRICRGLAQLATKRQSLPAKKHGCMPM